MIKKIIMCLFIGIFLVGIVFSAGETTTTSNTAGGSLIEKIGDLVLTLTGVELTKGENENTLTFLDGGSVKVGDTLFKNVKKDSIIKLDSSGEIKSADLTATADKTVFTLGNEPYEVSKGNRLIYENGKARVEKGSGGSSLRWKPKILDGDGKDIGQFMDIKMNGDFVEIEKYGDGNIFTGNMNIGENIINGLNGGVGKATISNKDGRILKVWENTDANIYGIKHTTSNNKIDISYDGNFVVPNANGINYVNYGDNKISLGGTGFTTDFGSKNKVLGDMGTTKNIEAITKTRNFDVTMNGGNLEISRDLSVKNDLRLNINGDGNFVINDGRAIIESKKISKIINGRLTYTGEDSIFVKENPVDKNGLLYSYDLNFNNEEYKLENNFFKNKFGNVLVNTNKPWENIAYNVINLDTTQGEIDKIEKITGKGTYKNWNFAFEDEKLNKVLYESVKIANLNKDGIKLSEQEFAATCAGEGWFFKQSYGDAPTTVWKDYKENPNSEFIPNEMAVGLNNLPGLFDELKKGGFIPSGSSLVDNPSGPRIKRNDLPIFAAGLLAYFKSQAKKAVGEEEWNKKTPSQQFALTTFAYNTKHATKTDISKPVTVEEGYDFGPGFDSAVKNSKIREAIYMDFDKYFSYP